MTKFEGAQSRVWWFSTSRRCISRWSLDDNQSQVESHIWAFDCNKSQWPWMTWTRAQRSAIVSCPDFLFKTAALHVPLTSHHKLSLQCVSYPCVTHSNLAWRKYYCSCLPASTLLSIKKLLFWKKMMCSGNLIIWNWQSVMMHWLLNISLDFIRLFVLVLVELRPQSRSLESQTAGLQSLWLASRLTPWLRSTDGLWWLMAASHGLRVQTRKSTAAN